MSDFNSECWVKLSGMFLIVLKRHVRVILYVSRDASFCTLSLAPRCARILFQLHFAQLRAVTLAGV